MALTFSTTNWETMVGSKHYTPQALVSSARKMKIYIVDVTFGAGDNYATGGVTADLLRKGAKTLKKVIPFDNDAGVMVRYDVANKKILMYGQEPTNATAGILALSELAAASSIPNSKVFSFLVFAQD